MQRGTRTVWARMIGAAALNPNAYEAVKRDEHATVSALLIVLVTSIATGIGVFAYSGLSGLLWAVAISLTIWISYTGVAYIVGVTMFKRDRTPIRFGTLLRPLAFAQVPAFLLIVSGLPPFTTLLGILVSIWILAGSAVAVRQAFNLKTGSAVAVALVTWLLVLPLRYIILMIH